MRLEQYALRVLSEHGCDCHTYLDGEELMRDLKESYPDGMDFPYVDVANAILAMSRPKPIVRKPWMVVYDNDSTTDGVGADTLEDAKAGLVNIYCEWMSEERRNWAKTNYPYYEYAPTDEEKENWDYMIHNCSVVVKKYNPDTDEYDDYWSPDTNDLHCIGWVAYGEDEL